MSAKTNNLKQLISNFLDYLEIEKNRTKNTRKNYEFYLKRFAAWSNYSPPEKIDEELIKAYQHWLKQKVDKPLKPNTRNYHLIALRNFLKYLAKKKITTLVPEKIKLAKLPKRQIEFLEGQNLEKFLSAPLKIDHPEIIKLRDKAILELLISLGLKVSELINLKKEQIDFKKGQLIVQNKNGKSRVVALSNQAKYWLKKYLSVRSDFSLSLFIRHDRASLAARFAFASARRESRRACLPACAGRRRQAKGKKELKSLTPRSIQRLIQKYAKTAGIKKIVTPRTLRHSFAVKLINSGSDTQTVQTALGYTSSATTRIYQGLTK